MNSNVKLIRPRLSRITVFPIKALPGVDLDEVELTSAGALRYDRQFALFDADGRPVNGKRHPEVNQIHAEYDLYAGQVSLDIEGFDSPERFKLQADNVALITWLSDFFGFPISLRENEETGFPDDTKRPGPTLISLASLDAVASWFDQIDLDEARRRFRSNLEITDCPAFWEDQLSITPDVARQFRLGDNVFAGLKHCVRCPVPTQDTKTGEVIADFQAVFLQKREETLPAWADASMFEHLYSLAINTRVVRSGASLALGDSLELIG